ncbi:hypothetical protein PENANT_c006G09578 [Penicillium antarcticum]|uniref:Uncharacterized protein n=1 Tax=Penicillium antarcticum TaxID=416450 RepID=A0A1V6QDH1_9EURO|nr:uncharacterized protein N7508_009485 [Penicillium antarcticum]KAJ5294664.1 hypothetical protein N7508_009485 [Penicillium antarcticum]OQD87092.1 hypothetical protein PENANT_c006G09578 [Penicillium antarcticum]
MAARIQSSEKQEPSPPRSQPNSLQSPQTPMSRYYSQSIKSSTSENHVSSPEIKSPLTVQKSSNESTIGEQTLLAEAHIAGLLEASGRVKCVVEQTEQLRNEKMDALGEIEGEWINSTIADAESAADDLLSFINPLWNQSNKTGGLTPKERKSWKRRDCQTATKKETRMTLGYERLVTVFGHLKTIPPTSELAATERGQEAALAASGSPPVLAVAAELSCQTTVVSTIELPCPTKILELQTERAIPKIIVTQYEDDAIDVTSPDREDAPNFPPSYEIGQVKKDDELFFS